MTAPTITRTVITLSGAWSFGAALYVMPGMLNGEVTNGARDIRAVNYKNWTLDWRGTEVLEAVDMLDAEIADVYDNTTDDIEVFAHSLGAVVCCRWLKLNGPTSRYDPARLKFKLIGNSMRRYGGVLFDEDYAAPIDTPYTVVDVARQYDGWADWPQSVPVPDLDTVNFTDVMDFIRDVVSSPAALNAINGANTIHVNYRRFESGNPRNETFTEGNITYVLMPTYPLPDIQSNWLLYTPERKREEDIRRRPGIELEYDRPMTTPAAFEEVRRLHALDDLDNQMKEAGENRAHRRALKRSRPVFRCWKNKLDGSPGAVFAGRAHSRDVVEYEFPMKKNFSSAGRLVLRADHPVAKWGMRVPNNPEECKNILITVDLYGGRWRWSGLLHHWDIETRDGVDYFTMSFNDDMQFLSFMLAPPNPLLPIPIFQFPRDWPMFGPSVWAISTLILLQLIRLNGNLWTLPDDPFDLDQWFDIIEWGDWQVHIKSPNFFTDSSLWTFLTSRMNTVDSVIADALDDGQLSLEYRRIITDDGESATGLLDNNVANCALVFEVKDKSGWTLPGGTFFSGSAGGGFIRSVLQWTDGFVGDTLTQIFDTEDLYPDEYWQQSWVGTLASAPANALRDSHWMDMQSKVTWSPATASSVIVGGDNPTVDAIAELIIQSVGNLIGYFLLGGFDSLGDIAADVIMPFITGTIFAWDQWENSGRAQNLGWIHLWEVFQEGADNAWSLAALAAMRGGFKGTESQTSHTMVVDDSTWFMAGLHGTIGDRTGSTSGALQRNAGIDLMFVNQIEEMVLQGDEAGDYQFTMKLGQNKAAMSTGERLARMMKKFSEFLTDVGVRLTT